MTKLHNSPLYALPRMQESTIGVKLLYLAAMQVLVQNKFWGSEGVDGAIPAILNVITAC